MKCSKSYMIFVFLLVFAKFCLSVNMNKEKTPISYKYSNNFFKELRKQKSEMPENKAIFLYTPNVSLNCKTTEHAVKVQWLYHDIDGSYMIRTITDNGEVRMPKTYALNMSYPGQNSLIILNATMKTAGTYNCLVSYNTMDVKSFSSEINIVTVSKSTGSVIAPFMYFDWKVLYNGRMTPFIKCSNGRILKGIKKHNSLPYILFSSCFKPEYLPKYCDIFFKDNSKKLTRFKRYKLEILRNDINHLKPLRMEVNKIIVVKEPTDLIISFNRTNSLEMLCEVLPPPSELIWTFMDIEEKCYLFENSPGVISKIETTSMHYKIFNKNRYSSRINFFNVDYSAVGQVRCLAVYFHGTVTYKTLTAEIVIVTKFSQFIEMNILREVSEGKEIMVKFIIYYSGNLKPILVCANSEFDPKDIRKENYNYRAEFYSIQVIPVVPYECDVKFVNPFTKKKTLFKKVYIKIIGNLFRESNKAFNLKENKQDIASNQRKYPIKSRNDDSLFDNSQHVFPKNVITNDTTKTVDFHCLIKVPITTLSWTLEGASKLHSGIIYQKESGIAQVFVDLFSLNTSLAGQHSLTVLKVSPITAGTYTCVVTYQNETTISYPAGLVIANFIIPMSLKYTANRENILFYCSLKFCGNMQPFLRCENQLDQYGIMTNLGKLKKVVFERLMNITNSPVVCSLWFKHSRGEEIFHKEPIILMDVPMGIKAADGSGNKVKSYYFLYSMFFVLLEYF